MSDDLDHLFLRMASRQQRGLEDLEAAVFARLAVARPVTTHRSALLVVTSVSALLLGIAGTRLPADHRAEAEALQPLISANMLAPSTLLGGR
jgi:hypothetical protein